jgi:S-adenosylmethionine synthetase
VRGPRTGREAKVLTHLVLESSSKPPLSESAFEIVERKGIGHPDSICDAVMDEAARAIARAHVEAFGQPKHFNLDKGLLAAGRSEPRFGGGSVLEPMKLIFGDRAIAEVEGVAIPVRDILVEASRRWFRRSLRFVDPDRHVVFQNEVRAGSAQLTGLFATRSPPANDTSAAFAFAPWTTTERIALESERFLNDASLKGRHPEVGEDVKVMAIRREKALSLTVAIAFVDRFVDSDTSYLERKERIRALLRDHISERLGEIDSLSVAINTLDAAGGGADSLYLTVTGTSAEGGDSGQVGRGNRLCGIFPGRRPSSAEATAGKNPHSHVGKIYNYLAQRIADRIATLEPVREVGVHLVSQIGKPLTEAELVAIELVLAPKALVSDVRSEAESIVDAVLREAPRFADWWVSLEGPV